MCVSLSRRDATPPRRMLNLPWRLHLAAGLSDLKKRHAVTATGALACMVARGAGPLAAGMRLRSPVCCASLEI